MAMTVRRATSSSCRASRCRLPLSAVNARTWATRLCASTLTKTAACVTSCRHRVATLTRVRVRGDGMAVSSSCTRRLAAVRAASATACSAVHRRMPCSTRSQTSSVECRRHRGISIVDVDFVMLEIGNVEHIKTRVSEHERRRYARNDDRINTKV